MYLVELRPGKEELYRSSDELALAIRNGEVDARSRIYHRATAKWISITLHPQYKAIITTPKEEPATRPARKGWTFLGGIAPAAEPVAQSRVSNGTLLQRLRGPLTLGISGVLLILGVQLAFWGPRPPWAGARAVASAPTPQRAAAPAKVRPEDRQEIVSLASTTTVWPGELPPVRDTIVSLPAAVEPNVPKKSSAVLPKAPQFRPTSLSAALATKTAKKGDLASLSAVMSRYAAAHDSARARLEGGFRVARLSQLFAASRLTPTGGVPDTRMSLAGAANFIRIFRKQQAAIEAAYQDSASVFAKQGGWTRQQVRDWYSRPIRAEEPTLQSLSNNLLAAIDSLLGVLDAQAGAYKIRGSAIAFEEPAAAKAYSMLRRRIEEQVDSAVAAGGATAGGPTSLLLRAIGTTTLPRET
jgi:hypothetical protein